ncbi:MAG: RluA family pseudouridine synthase [Bacteroidales bacterium]|nr:RluA family pseudouridine synthase [Bacteroidales bacterium]
MHVEDQLTPAEKSTETAVQAATDLSDQLLPTSDTAINDDEEEEEEGGFFEHYRFEVPRKQALLRIDKYLVGHLEGTSRHRVQQAIDAGYVQVNGQTAKANYRVKPLDLITISMPYRRRGVEILPEKMDLDIRYEDDDLLLVNKPAGLVVHPGCGNYTGTLVNGLAYYLGKRQEAEEGDERMGMLVHRIDKDTSGILLIAKNDEAQLKLAEQFFHHTIDRKYIAIVWGDVKEDSGTIVGHIARDPNNRQNFKVFPDGSAGKHAITHYRVLERLGYVTVVECKLETGRTHQIRVHMNYLGHPLFNDSRYGGDRILKGTLYAKYKKFIDNCFEILPRQALHAKNLGFVHPRTGDYVFVESELPEDMTRVIERFRVFSSGRRDP